MDKAQTSPGAGPSENDSESVLLVGGSSDIGLELIRQFAHTNTVFLAHYHRSARKLEDVALSVPGVRIVPLQADLSQPDGVEGLIAVIRERRLVPTRIVHLAAPKLEYVRFKDVRWAEYEHQIQVQLRSLVSVLQAFLPAMAERKCGKVVVVLSSVTVGVPPGALSPYVTAKFALLGLLRSLAAEYSSKQVNINAVSPSMVETAFLEKLPARMVEIAAAQSPWQRNATAIDVAAAIRFLLSAESNYVTGANLPISGGASF
jgi:3-oxoacyl-[acyl-carrier protein] reductase